MTKFLLLFALLLAARFTPAGRDDAADDLKTLAGQWVCVAETFDGDEVPGDVASKHSYTIKDDKLTVRGGLAKLGDKFVALKSEDAYKITLGTADKLKTIDLKEDKDGGRTIPGLYKLENGKLVVVLNYKNSDRPAAFESKADTGTGLFTLEKEEKKDGKKDRK